MNNHRKVPLIKEMLFSEKIAFIALTETHLNVDIMDSEIQIDGYHIIRRDRINRSHGGVAIYIIDILGDTAKIILDYTDNTIEALGVIITRLNLCIIVIYRPPNTTSSQFMNLLTKLKLLYNDLDSSTDVIMLGDFNFPSILWPSMNLSSSSMDKNQALEFIEFVEDYMLSQFIREPTRNDNILDLVFSNNEQMLHSYYIYDTSLSDHKFIKIVTNYSLNKETQSINISDSKCGQLTNLNFKNSDINWNIVSSELEDIDWCKNFTNKNVDENFEIFIEICYNICVKHVPTKLKITKKFNIIPKDRKILMKRRHNIRMKISDTSRDNNIYRQKLEEIEKKLLMSHENQILKEENIALSNIQKNPKYFYLFARRKMKTPSNVGPLQIQDKYTNNPIEMANVLSKQYESVFSVPKRSMVVSDPYSFFNKNDSVEQTMCNIEITEDDIAKAIDMIPPNASSGCYGFDVVFLKKCKMSLCEPLQLLWNKSLKTGKIPMKLKESIITPIYKGGNKGEAKNYRPIALTSHIIKIAERIIKNHVVEYMNKYNLFNNGQHGFRNGRSCLSQLINHYENIISNLQKGGDVDVIYLDFAKAFDKVDHGILLHKLKYLGIEGNLGVWIHVFLSMR